MKKTIITLAMIITLATSAFAGDEKVKGEIQKAFIAKFSGAKDVTWRSGIDYYKATFNHNGSWMFAYYDKTAGLMAQGRNISSTQLPIYLQHNFKNRYSEYWITDLFELSNDDGFRYYLTLQNADNTVILVSNNGSDWTTRK